MGNSLLDWERGRRYGEGFLLSLEKRGVDVGRDSPRLGEGEIWGGILP